MVSINVGVLHYVLDHIYGACVHRTKFSTPFFSRGWGGTKLELFESMLKQLFPGAVSQNWPPNMVQPIWKQLWESKNACLKEGIFRTPCDEQLINALPPESHTARIALLTPKSVPPHKMACVVHLAGTGDHTYERRLRLGGPLLKENIATMVLESPFYGNRRPKLQRGAKLLCVSDLLLLGRATIEEARSLLHWLDVEGGFGKMGICGLSMGGVHAAMVGSLHPTPIATLPFLAPHSAVVAFCEGVLKHATAWDALREDAEKAGMTLEEVQDRLRTVLSLTDVTRFPIPKSPESVILVAATVEAQGGAVIQRGLDATGEPEVRHSCKSGGGVVCAEVRLSGGGLRGAAQRRSGGGAANPRWRLGANPSLRYSVWAKHEIRAIPL